MKRTDLTPGKDYAYQRSKWSKAERVRVVDTGPWSCRAPVLLDQDPQHDGRPVRFGALLTDAPRHRLYKADAVLVEMLDDDGTPQRTLSGEILPLAVRPTRKLVSGWGEYLDAEARRVTERDRLVQERQEKAAEDQRVADTVERLAAQAGVDALATRDRLGDRVVVMSVEDFTRLVADAAKNRGEDGDSRCRCERIMP